MTANAVSALPMDLRVRHLQMLVDLSQELAAKDSLDDVLATLVEAIVKVTGAEGGSLFLNDAERQELYSRVTEGHISREIRFRNDKGIAGAVFQSGQREIIHDPYSDDRFYREIDQQTGFVTRSILCAPVRSARGEVIGVAQVLNKTTGAFADQDLDMLEMMTQQAAVVLRGIQDVERIERLRREEMEFLDLVATVTSELDLNTVLQHIMAEATRMLNAERSTLFINDSKSNELFARVAQGGGVGEIRLPNHMGIAGTVFASGKSVNIPHAYADLRFNPSFDKKTGFFTRSILCVPVANKLGQIIGVTQVLNKRGGPFTDSDENRLKAFTAQVAIALENAKLFEDVQKMKHYTESMLHSMTNGVLTLDSDGKIVTCNAAGRRILRAREAELIGVAATDFFGDGNDWLLERLGKAAQADTVDTMVDAQLDLHNRYEDRRDQVSVNLTMVPLLGGEGERLGTMVMIEDISSEKRLKATMSRYMDAGLAAQLLENREDDILGGKASEATVLFSDIRSFTTISEELGPQGTVALLNEYFTLMVECIAQEGGMLDKFIGDAIMAGFGVPVAHEDDPDRAVRSAIAMIRALDQWNIRREADGLPEVRIGIGLNTDIVVSGNIGSPKRMDYTMIGDGVNLAARLESASKFYGAKILVSDHTVRRLRGVYRLREVDLVVVKGKTEPVAIHELLDAHTERTFPDIMSVLTYFQDGVTKYRARDFARARESFREALARNPDDAVSAIYVQRCNALIASPPPADWNGVFVMATK